jgi:hypothetical protein
MTTIQINEKTKMGKHVLQMLKALAKAENENSIRFLDETEFLFSTEANKKALLQGVEEVKAGKKGKTIKPSVLWK